MWSLSIMGFGKLMNNKVLGILQTFSAKFAEVVGQFLVPTLWKQTS